VRHLSRNPRGCSLRRASSGCGAAAGVRLRLRTLAVRFVASEARRFPSLLGTPLLAVRPPRQERTRQQAQFCPALQPLNGEWPAPHRRAGHLYCRGNRIRSAGSRSSVHRPRRHCRLRLPGSTARPW